MGLVAHVVADGINEDKAARRCNVSWGIVSDKKLTCGVEWTVDNLCVLPWNVASPRGYATTLDKGMRSSYRRG